MINGLLAVYGLVLYCLPVALAGAGVVLFKSSFVRICFLAAAPLIFGLSYVTFAGVLSRFTRKAIIPGIFPRELSHPVYGPRRLWAFCWTSVFYFAPLYFVCISFEPLKHYLFRIFGYEGNLNFSIAPDAWIRDIPLLEFGAKCYVSNKSTVGSNICLADNKVLVQGVTIKENAMVGHMSLVAPGVVVGESVELGVHTAVGIRTKFGRGSKTGPVVSIHHGVSIGEGADIGAATYIGLRAVIGNNIRLPIGTGVPAGAKIETQDDVRNLISSETNTLNEKRTEGLRRVFEGDEGSIAKIRSNAEDEAS